MIKYITTKENVFLQQWDAFVMSHPQGVHLQYSHWVKSYLPYGFDFEIGLALKNDEIIGGYAAVIAQKAGFKFYCIANGPVFLSTTPQIQQGLIAFAKQSAMAKKCCCLQVAATIIQNRNHENGYLPDVFQEVYQGGAYGKPFPFVYASAGLNWIDFSGITSKEDFLQNNLKSNLRRDIRSATRKQIIIQKITDPAELKKVYDVFENNAKEQGYNIRAWNDFKATLIGLVSENKGVVIGGYHLNKLKGALFLLKAGGYYTYVMGGTLKEKPDLLMGELLQWSAIELSFEENTKGYNISLGGSPGVVNFKNKFSPEVYSFQNNSYYWVLRPVPFAIYKKLFVYLKKYKSVIIRLLSKK